MLATGLKVFSVSAIVGYGAAIALYVTPASWSLSATIVYCLCPPTILTFGVGPSASSVVAILAPLNAIAYGLLGLGSWFAYRETRTEIGEYLKRRNGISTSHGS